MYIVFCWVQFRWFCSLRGKNWWCKIVYDVIWCSHDRHKRNTKRAKHSCACRDLNPQTLTFTKTFSNSIHVYCLLLSSIPLILLVHGQKLMMQSFIWCYMMFTRYAKTEHKKSETFVRSPWLEPADTIFTHSLLSTMPLISLIQELELRSENPRSRERIWRKRGFIAHTGCPCSSFEWRSPRFTL